MSAFGRRSPRGNSKPYLWPPNPGGHDTRVAFMPSTTLDKYFFERNRLASLPLRHHAKPMLDLMARTKPTWFQLETLLLLMRTIHSPRQSGLRQAPGHMTNALPKADLKHGRSIRCPPASAIRRDARRYVFAHSTAFGIHRQEDQTVLFDIWANSIMICLST